MADSRQESTQSPLSVDNLLYRRSEEYAKRLYIAHLKAKRLPVPKASDEFASQVDAVRTRLLEKYPYRILLSQ
jgi:hypothetical protein